MLRLTMVDDPTFTPSDADETARAAAIAAMGYRLAAAGPRTRQRLLDRQAGDDMPEEGFGISAAMLRRLAVIGAAGACSFGLVLAAQGRNWNFLTAAGPEATIIAQADQPRASAPPIISSLAKLPTLTVGATAEDHPQQLAVAEPPAAPKMPAAPKTLVHSAIPAKAAHLFADISHPHLRQVAARTDPVAAPRVADAKPHVLPHPVAVAHYELPHWLTDYHPEPKHALVMSEPPHDLVPPASAEHHAAAPEPAPVLPPVRMQYASAAPAPRPMPALRPPYGYGYGGPYAYGGPAYYPYAPPPPPYYYQRW